MGRIRSGSSPSGGSSGPFSGVFGAVGDHVGCGGIRGEVEGIRDADGRGTDDLLDFTSPHAIRFGLAGSAFVTEGNGVLKALGRVHLTDQAGGGNSDAGPASLADGETGGGALGVGHGAVYLDLRCERADFIDQRGVVLIRQPTARQASHGRAW